MTLHRLILGTPSARIEVGGGVALLFFDDGSHAPHGIGVEHVCIRWPGDVKVVAPAVHPIHTVTKNGGGSRPITYTILPSIACPDCGLHGFVTDSEWMAAA